jgi:hypothetical protein
MPRKRNRFAIGGPFLSLVVLMLAVVAILAMEHFH